ncbi:MAG: roadblock/LC7 domain-containing protein [Gemmatimonadota bacterium]|jgi:predicted regulator of Ras-like GTPase activity (Roadblock/LC7/MglB family)|nr:roadblock/LC7 domain-containing protein [Candidatus Palauibacterales bacterium]
MRTDAFKSIIERVIGTPGVRGALVVAVRDGLVVDGRVHVGVPGEAVAALAASLFRRARSATDGNGTADVRFVELEAEKGRIVIAGKEELALMAVMESRANAGQVRLAVRRAADDLAAAAGS